MGYPKCVKIVEVGPRDGLQNEKEIIPTEDKIQFINLLSESGLRVIEAGSFVHPKRVPQLADAAEVYQKIKKKPGVSYPMLVPNQKGLDRALEIGVREIAVFTAASETFNKKNINRTIAESLDDIRQLIRQSLPRGLHVRGYVSTCFVCPYEGKMVPERVTPIVEKLFDLGVEEVSIGDTIGAAVPEDVEKLMSLLFKKSPREKLAVHFHDTQGRALANILKSLELGIGIVDSSAGGLGGCPYAPGASGNVATEDVLERLHQIGVKTGVDLEKIVEASRFMSSVLKRALPSQALPSCR